MCLERQTKPLSSFLERSKVAQKNLWVCVTQDFVTLQEPGWSVALQSFLGGFWPLRSVPFCIYLGRLEGTERTGRYQANRLVAAERWIAAQLAAPYRTYKRRRK